jgi:hypothetical protein
MWAEKWLIISFVNFILCFEDWSSLCSSYKYSLKREDEWESQDGSEAEIEDYFMKNFNIMEKYHLVFWGNKFIGKKCTTSSIWYIQTSHVVYINLH